MELVKLNLYDVSRGMCTRMNCEPLYTCGIVVFDREFYFGEGVCVDAPGCTSFGKAVGCVVLGETEVEEEMFIEMLEDVRARFTKHTLDLLTCSPLTFGEECAQLLLGQSLPQNLLLSWQKVMASPAAQKLKTPLLQAIRSMTICSNPLFQSDTADIPLTAKQQDVPMGRMPQPGV